MWMVYRRPTGRRIRCHYLKFAHPLPIFWFAQDAERGGPEGRFLPGAHPELLQCARDVVVDGPHGQHEFLGDLRVREATAQQAKHLHLPGAEDGRMVRPRTVGPPGNPRYTEAPRLRPDPGGERFGTERGECTKRAAQVFRSSAGSERRRVLVRTAGRGPGDRGVPPATG